MSIINLSEAGDWLRRNQADVAIFIGFILVAIIAFGAGRLSVPAEVRNPIVVEEAASSSANIYNGVSQTAASAAGDLTVSSPANSQSTKGLFVASRGGTKYHWPWCSWGERIKPENQIWFNSEAEARAAGYTPCGCVASKAPAGYKAN